MAPRGGYKKNTDPRGEYVRLDQLHDAEAKLCAAKMGQPLPVWIADAVEHHLFRCEQMMGLERWREDELEAARTNSPSPMKTDARYQPGRRQPTITRTPAAGQGSGPGGRSYRP